MASASIVGERLVSQQRAAEFIAAIAGLFKILYSLSKASKMRPVSFLFAFLISSVAAIGQDCSSSLAVLERAPVTPVRNLLTKIRDIHPFASSCSGVEKVAVVRVHAVRVAPRSTSCSGVKVSGSCSGSRLVAAEAPKPPVQSASLAQRKAEQQASSGRMSHVGGGYGGGTREGVGYSSRSAREAIEKSCYYGRYQPRDIGVARGSTGWFAAVLY